jgi:hypothetical protein
MWRMAARFDNTALDRGRRLESRHRLTTLSKDDLTTRGQNELFKL